MKKKNYKISILITNYNKSQFLNKSLNSILNQDYKNYEIILYDDCSTDDSLNIINKYKKIKLIKCLKKDKKKNRSSKSNYGNFENF